MDPLTVLAVLALLFTVVMLARGIRSMMRGGEANEAMSTRLMLRRVEWQAAAFGLILAALFFALS